MEILSFRPALAVLVSLCAAILIITLGNRIRPNQREAITVAAAVTKAVLVFSMVPQVLKGNFYRFTFMEITEGVDLTLKTDEAGIIFACVASFLWILVAFYSIGYMRGHGEINQTGYYAAFAMCLSSTIGICFAANLLTFFIFYETLTICTYPLVVHYRDNTAKAAGRKYLSYTLLGGQLFFAGIICVYAICGTGDFKAGGFMQSAVENGELSLNAALVIFFLMVAAGAVKAGVMPLHSWLPAAMVAPTPVSALLHAVAVVKAGAFCILRIVCYVLGPELAQNCGGTKILSWFAIGTILVSSLIAIQRDNLKARLAYSTIGQLSYVVLGVCIFSTYSIAGAIYHIVAHAFMKITLFMCAGAIFVTTHKANISEMRGVGRQMPITMACFTVASLGIAGMPFVVGFVSKANILQGALEVNMPLAVAALIASALLSLSYLLPVGFIAFSGKDQDLNCHGGEASIPMLIPIVITTVIIILLGIWPNLGPQLLNLAFIAANGING